ncbi:MAG: DnaJ domain-containing protein [Nitrososphaeraceae archaeon]|nr:DnaJ domain-containing protein [Nitrososphaeraceae archaeon]MDW3603929.1 DnaJ domain-containing protein [Nitrososphaeraceae archaeon]
MSDYYKILGVTKDSNQIQIRKAFRKLALQYHPDKNKNSEESKQKFMEIVKAYEILSDEKARERYDSNTVDNKNIQKFNWTPPADFANFYSYENLKREYNENQITGGMWEISEKANAGLWKATFILLASLGLVSIFILLKIY